MTMAALTLQTLPKRGKFLYAALQLPWPPDNGQKIVTLNDLTLLSQHFDIDVVSYVDPLNLSRRDDYLQALTQRLPHTAFLEPISHDILRGDLWRDKVRPFVRGLVTKIPFVVSKYMNDEYAHTVARLLDSGRYTAFYFESLGPSFVLPSVSLSSRRRTKIIYRAFDWFSETLTSHLHQLPFGPVKLAVGLDALVCRSYERSLWAEVDLIVPVTARLSAQIGGDSPSVRPKLIHLPVVVDFPEAQTSGCCGSPPHVLYVGTVHYPPNLLGLKWFVRECWPRVLERHPHAIFDVVGRGGDQLGPVHASVRIHNYASDLATMYASACAFVVPLFAGSGIRLKILDALVHGIPVVTTSAGYLGLDTTPGEEVLVANTPVLFATHLCMLLENEAKREELAHNGRRFLQSHHGPDTARRSLTSLINRLESTTAPT